MGPGTVGLALNNSEVPAMGATELAVEHVSCPLCAGPPTVVFSRQDALTQFPTPFSVVRCQGCDLVYLSPRPAREDMHRFYPPEFVSFQFEALPAAERKTVGDRLLSYVTSSMAVGRIKTVKKHVPLDRPLRVLDVGCGKGHFLYQMREATRCEVAGIDMDQESARYCRDKLGIPVIHGDMAALRQIRDKYDLITMWHFLEHEYDPLSTLSAVRHCLEPGGKLLVEIPNGASLENRLFRKRSYLYDVPRHLFNFSPATIQVFLEKAGFQVEKISCTYNAGGWLGTAQQILTGGRIYRKMREHMIAVFLLSGLLLPLDFLLSFTQVGSVMDVVAAPAG